MSKKLTKSYSLKVINPLVSNEWHPTKNGDLTPFDVFPESGKKAWWICKFGHEWNPRIADRNNGSNCPYCSGRKAGKDNNLAVINPGLCKEWHPTKNKKLTPFEVTPGSNTKVWWVCKKGHEWKAQIVSRNNGAGCPYCSGLKAGTDNNLAVINPGLSKEWHPKKNGTLTPFDVVPGSVKKVWWICKKGHEWQAQIAHRNRGSGCPYCSNRKAGKDNNLAVINPGLSKEWHPKKNGTLTPFDVVPGSIKKVWWICKKGHEWLSVIAVRHTKGYGCPYCSGNKVGKYNNLAVINPGLCEEWHPTRNKELTPFEVKPGSKTKVWWICKKGHEWQAQIAHRNRGSGCPYCTGNKVGKDNNLAVINPGLCKEWHPTKNKKLTPFEVTPGSNTKVWWVCKKGHEYETTVTSRTRGTDCPYCRNKYSKFELRVYCELSIIFDEVKFRYKIKGIECDVFIPKKNIAIEIDGYPWHDGFERRDRKKTKSLLDHGIKLYRIRDEKLKKLSEEDILYKSSENKYQIKAINNILKLLITNNHLNENEKIKAEKYFIDNKYKNNKEFFKILSNLPGPPPGESFFELYPEKSKYWDYVKNYPLTPQLFYPKSLQSVWWKCDQGHEIKQPIVSRVNSYGNGCKICSNKDMGLLASMLAAETAGCLADKHPELISEWHNTKNGDRNPYNVSVSSSFVAWWICDKGHEWEAIVSARTKQKQGCPYCSNHKVCDDNNLEILYKNIAKEWHPSLNGNLKPNNVVPGTSKKVWWLCPNGHTYKTQVRYRTIFKSKCPYCSGRRVSKNNSLEFLFPEIAKQWHPIKNNGKKPSDFTRGSGYYAWWICENGHEWKTKIQHRTVSKSGCPICAKIKRTKILHND